jgi:hypothetical protein
MKQMVKLIATKAYNYATRRLQAEDEFEARPMDANLLVRAKKARYSDTRETGKLVAPPARLKRKAVKAAKTPPTRTATVEPSPPVAKPSPPATAVPAMTTKNTPLAPAGEADELTTLRQQYKEKFNKAPFMGWSAATLQDKLAEK